MIEKPGKFNNETFYKLQIVLTKFIDVVLIEILIQPKQGRRNEMKGAGAELQKGHFFKWKGNWL